MATEVLAPGTTAANSADIVVVAGAPVHASLYRDDEEKIEPRCTCPVFKQDPNGNWNHTTWSLNHDSPTRILVGAGTYQIRRSGGLDYPTGISID